MDLKKEYLKDILLFVVSIGLGILIHKIGVMTRIFPISLFVAGILVSVIRPVNVWCWALGLVLGFFGTVYFEQPFGLSNSDAPPITFIGIMGFNFIIFCFTLVGAYISAFFLNKKSRLKHLKEISLIFLVMGILLFSMLICSIVLFIIYSSKKPEMRQDTEGGMAMVFMTEQGIFFSTIFLLVGGSGLLLYRHKKKKLASIQGTSIEPPLNI